MTHAIFVEKSRNAKVRGKAGGEVAVTYASIEQTCPSTCALKKTGECYATGGHVGLVVNRLDKAGDTTPLAVARQEAAAIDAAFKGGPIPQDGARGGRDLRLHVSGDCRTASAARTVAAAVARYKERGGEAAWSYSHAWKTVPREAWGSISILASIDKIEDVEQALERGYAPARYVPEFPSAKTWEEAGVRWTPCPAQVKHVGCADCRLCFDAPRLHRERRGIAFFAHGVREKAMKRRLRVLTGEQPVSTT